MNYGLSDKTLNTMYNILRDHPEVDSAILYGSRAKGNYKPGSDIDLSLIGDSLSHQVLLRIMRDFHESSIPYLVDLTIFNQIYQKRIKSPSF